jgi:hypothetical protein
VNLSRIAASFLLVLPFAASCALSEDEIATDEQGMPAEIDAADEAAPSTQQSLLGNTCKNTDIFITNSRTRNGIDTAIEVTKVELYSASEGDWISEDLSNEILDHGTTGIWWDEDLAGAENDLITKWRVYYKYVVNGSWSSVVYQEIDTPNQTCLANANFYMTVE